MNRAELKQAAKDSLKGKYGQAILVMIIFGLISGAASGIITGIFGTESETGPMVSSLVSVVISCLFVPGYTSFFMKIARNENVEYSELFSKIKLFVPYLLITLLTGIFVCLWSLLFIIPGIIAAYGYSLVTYILLDNPEMGAMDVLRKSKEMMNGHKMDLFVLHLSFIGWAILGMLTCGILYLWLTPYMTVTEIKFYEALKAQNN